MSAASTGSDSHNQGPGFPAGTATTREGHLGASRTPRPEQRGNGESDLMELLTREFEGTIIRTALRHTRGRRIDAALRLGIGRNTITRKIQDLKLEDD